MTSEVDRIFRELKQSASQIGGDAPVKYRVSRRRGRKKRSLNSWTYDAMDMNMNEMKSGANDKFFVGASDYADWLHLQLLDSRTEKKMSTFNSDLKMHGNRKKWQDFINEEFDGDYIIQYTDSSGLIVTEGLNFIRYDVNSNSVSTHTYGDKIFIENVEDIFLKHFDEVTSYIEWVYGANGDSVNVPLNAERLPVDEMYPFLKEPLTEYYDRYLESNANILLLIGPPGTGKTTFIRGLLAHSNSSAIVTYDAAILEKDYLFARFIEDETGVMVLEDSDNFLKARSDGNTMMHRFLNVGDGLVTTKGKKLIFSTNLPSIRDIDPALIRPGRCFDIVSFDTLKQKEAEALAKKIGVKLDGKRESWTIAEVFNKQIEEKNTRTVGSKMGFV
jgi:hypothetical protein